MPIDPRPTLDAPDDDPHLWLEEIDGAAALDWVAARTAETLERFGGAALDSDAAELAAIYDQPDKIPHIRRRGELVYNFWTDADHPRGLWRRARFDDYRSNADAWEVLLDIDAVAAAEGVDWVWRGASTLVPDHARALVWLSRGGADAAEMREFDLGRRVFVADGFRLPEAKGSAAWLDQDNVLVFSALGAEQSTRSGYARSVRLWRRGAAFEAAETLLATDQNHMSVWAEPDRTAERERIWFIERTGFFEERLHLGDRSGPQVLMDLPADAWIGVEGDWLAVKLRQDWSIGDRRYAADALLGIGLAAFLAGDRDFQILFTPAPRRVLNAYFWCGGRLVASILDDLRPVREIWSPGTADWSVERDESAPAISSVHTAPLDQDPEASDGAFVSIVQAPTRPATLRLHAPGAASATLRETPPRFDAAGLVSLRFDARAADGVLIPYIATGPAAAFRAPSGDAPTHLSGYGGFGLSETPRYDAAVGKLWLERGGVSVVAHIRGGGEFGTAWHDAGRRENKIQSHDDFAAVAADLVARGVTNARRIAAEGGSNGGLLIANMLTRWPESFGGLFCTIPLIDMRRYAQLLAGASWIDEYGDPGRPEDWAYLSRISAYHTAAPARGYPPILIATTRRDDRVHPGHARKMAAKLSAIGATAHYYELAGGGHGFGETAADRARFAALGFRFLADAIGWRPIAP